MQLNQRKFFLGLIVLIAYVGIGALGVVAFGHTSEAPMPNCPYAPGEFALCSDTLEHVSNWQAFSNIILPLIFISLVLVGFLYLLIPNILNPESFFYRLQDSNTQKSFYVGVILKWLSLFENSPSLAYSRQY